MEKKLKISASAYRVLLLLKKLNESDFCADDLNNIFCEDIYVKRYFTKDVITKYINTLKLAGYNISKNNQFYKLNNPPVKVDFSEEELKTIALLKRFASCLHQARYYENYVNFLEKTKRFMTPEDVHKLEKYCEQWDEKDSELFTKFDKYADLIRKIEQFIEQKQRVEIKYRLPQEETVRLALTELQSIKYEPDDISIICYNLVSNQINSIKISTINDIKQLPTATRNPQTISPVIFKIKGRLAEVYRPYEGEKLTDKDNKGHVTVTAYSDDIEVLLKRLLRYGENCEILYPKGVRHRMMTLIKSIIGNYN